MAKTHNKKRNVGLIFEQLVRYAIICLLDKKPAQARHAFKILKENFKAGTALHEEYQLFKALVNTRVDTHNVAERILTEARQLAVLHDAQQLRKEKSALIKRVNYELTRELYNTSVPLFKKYATAQVLLNSWRNPGKDISSRIMFEGNMVNMMSECPPEEVADVEYDDANNFTLRLVESKFSEGYDKKLNTYQRELIRSYVFKNDIPKIRHVVNEMKKRVSERLTDYVKRENNETINENYQHVRKKISALDVTTIDDNLVRKALMVAELLEEIGELNG